MKRLTFVLALALAVPAGLSFAQDAEKKTGETHEAAHDEEGGLELWKWANFAVLAAGLIYLIGKNAGPFFAARSAGIRKDLEESVRQREAAEARVAEVDRRLATLETEIAAVRAESERDLQFNAERLINQTKDQIAKLQVHAEQEIASAAKVARMELKRYAVDLAIDLAEQKIRARMNPDEQNALVDAFVRGLK